MGWEYLEIANFILGLATLALTIGILIMLRRADEILLRAKLFLNEGKLEVKKKGFIYQTWYYLLSMAVIIAIHSLAWLVTTSLKLELAYGIYRTSKTLFLGMLCLLATQWFVVAKECMRR
ncbi:MAG: hypothetical protein QMD21_02530 [Candidatus Thermoplasmatota archaeon]|nr:hypothetical protein [Candidatus Thermoplasmatota archaeon]MDI6887349.1 hypothetical protein [Candidatus Thermoplasmatota archaeon]